MYWDRKKPWSPLSPGRHLVGGLATLTTALLLMLIVALVVVYSSRTVLFELRVSGNTYKYEQALGAAEAGLETTLAQLNNGGPATPNRAAFFDFSSKKLLNASPIQGKLSATQSSYSVTLSQPDANDPLLLRAQAMGCADGCGSCSASCPVRTQVSQLLRIRPFVTNLPLDALTAKGGVTLNGKTVVVANSAAGWAIHAGGPVLLQNGAQTSPPGGKTYASDPAFTAPTPEQFFASFFSDTPDNIRAQATLLSSGQLPPQKSGGAFWIEGDATLPGNNASYGTPGQPILLIVNGNLSANGDNTVYGLVYVIGVGGAWANNGAGTLTIVGALVSQGSVTSTGAPQLSMDSTVLQALPLSTGVASKVMGSWRDF